MPNVAEVADRTYNTAIPLSEVVVVEGKKAYTKVSVNLPDELLERLNAAAESLPDDRSALIVSAIESCIDDFEAQARKVREVLDRHEKQAGKARKSKPA